MDTDDFQADAARPPSSRDIREAHQLGMYGLIPMSEYVGDTETHYTFPEQFVDELSRREVYNKHLFRPNTYLHKWWARRCGSTFRAILKQFAPEIERRDYYTPGGLEGMTVLDPMMGGGTTLHEAIRLGANVIGADIDPIPVLQARATLTYADISDLRTSFNKFFSRIHDNLKHYFETECPTCEKIVDSQYTLYGISKFCNCRKVVQVDQYTLRQEADRTIYICPESWDIVTGETRIPVSTAPARLVTKPEKICDICGGEYRELLDLPFYSRYIPIAIVASCIEHGVFFRPPGVSDLERIQRADEERSKLDFVNLDNFNVEYGDKTRDLIKHNVHSYLDTFSSRQLLYIYRAIQELKNYGKADRLNLGMLVSTSLEFNSMLCGYKGWYKRRPGAIRHVFALHAYSFQYTALENNPINSRKSSGNLQLLFRDRIERGRKWANLPVERRVTANGKSELISIPGEVDSGVEVFDQSDLEGENQRFLLIHGDSQDLPISDDSVDLIVTDPPYYDNVQYSNLAAFFRVWLPHLLPGEIEWNYDETQSAVLTKSGDGRFLTTLAGIFSECGRVLKTDTGRMAFTFHHWDPEAWAELTISLKEARFKLIDAYTVYSEHPISVHIRNLNSIKHDNILVFSLDTAGSLDKWTPLDTIDTTDSEEFCRQCASALGWLLNSQFTSSEIRTVWKRLMPGRRKHG